MQLVCTALTSPDALLISGCLKVPAFRTLTPFGSIRAVAHVGMSPQSSRSKQALSILLLASRGKCGSEILGVVLGIINNGCLAVENQHHYRTNGECLTHAQLGIHAGILSWALRLISSRSIHASRMQRLEEFVKSNNPNRPFRT